jgi:hypothetical protein
MRRVATTALRLEYLAVSSSSRMARRAPGGRFPATGFRP